MEKCQFVADSSVDWFANWVTWCQLWVEAEQFVRDPFVVEPEWGQQLVFGSELASSVVLPFVVAHIYPLVF